MNSAGDFLSYPWKEEIPQFPLTGREVVFERLYFWNTKEKLEKDKRVFQQTKDANEINELLHQFVKLTTFQARRTGINVTVKTLENLISNHFKFARNHDQVKDRLGEWMFEKVRQEMNFVRAEYLDHLLKKYYPDDMEGLQNKILNKEFTGLFNGKSLSNINNLTFKNAKVEGSIYNSTINYVDESSVIEKLEGDDCVVSKNMGFIWTSNCQIRENLNRIKFNLGNVHDNNGVIEFNERSGNVSVNGEGCEIKINRGSVDTNLGSVADNPEGVIKINKSNMAQNSGKVEVNEGEISTNMNLVNRNEGLIIKNIGIIEQNIGIIRANDSLVKTNAESGVIEVNELGRIETNLGVIKVNEGTVDTNENQLESNDGKLGVNNGAVITNNGKIDRNNSEVGENRFLIEINTGNIAINKMRLDKNMGIVGKNQGIVIANRDGGKITNSKKAVIVYNRSTVIGEGMIVFHYDQIKGSDLTRFSGEVKDNDPTRVEMFDLL